MSSGEREQVFQQIVMPCWRDVLLPTSSGVREPLSYVKEDNWPDGKKTQRTASKVGREGELIISPSRRDDLPFRRR